MTDIIAIAFIVIAVGLALLYIIKAKKSGRKCIGCPEGCCSKTGESGCSCCSGKSDSENSEEK